MQRNTVSTGEYISALQLSFFAFYFLATLATRFYHVGETAPLNDRSNASVSVRPKQPGPIRVFTDSLPPEFRKRHLRIYSESRIPVEAQSLAKK